LSPLSLQQDTFARPPALNFNMTILDDHGQHD